MADIGRGLEAAGRTDIIGQSLRIQEYLERKKAADEAAKMRAELGSTRVPLERAGTETPKTAQIAPEAPQMAPGRDIGASAGVDIGSPTTQAVEAIKAEEAAKVIDVEDVPAMKQLKPYPTAKNFLRKVAELNGWIENIGGVDTISQKNLTIAQGLISQDLNLNKTLNELALNDIVTTSAELESALADPKLKEDQRAQIQAQLEEVNKNKNAYLNAINTMDRQIQQEQATRQTAEVKPTPAAETTDIKVGDKIIRYQWNSDTERYDIPVGLVAPKTGQTINVNGSKSQSEFLKTLGSESAKALIQSQVDAQDSVGTINSIRVGRKQLEEGIFSGTAANVKLQFNKFLKDVGFNMAGKKVENTETFAANAGTLVGKIIKQFGSGTGLSDADRKYAMEIAGGNITVDEAAIRRLLDIAEKVNMDLINIHNKKANKVQMSKGFIESGLPIDLKVEVPNAATNGNKTVEVTNPDTGEREVWDLTTEKRIK